MAVVAVAVEIPAIENVLLMPDRGSSSTLDAGASLFRGVGLYRLQSIPYLPSEPRQAFFQKICLNMTLEALEALRGDTLPGPQCCESRSWPQMPSNNRPPD